MNLKWRLYLADKIVIRPVGIFGIIMNPAYKKYGMLDYDVAVPSLALPPWPPLALPPRLPWSPLALPPRLPWPPLALPRPALPGCPSTPGDPGIPANTGAAATASIANVRKVAIVAVKITGIFLFIIVSMIFR
jgi:hypothetical protein